MRLSSWEHASEARDYARMLGRALMIAATAGALAAGWALRTGALAIPDRLNPWAVLALAEPPNALTPYKLTRLTRDARLCLEVLATDTFTYERLTDRNTGSACGFRNAVRIDRMSSDVSESFSLTCRAAVSLALWERHVVQPAAQKHFGLPVARIEHFGSYACRNVYGRANARRSQHAIAEALDVAGFVLTDGERIRVLGHWDQEGPAADFLRDVRDGACRFFEGVLSPAYNEAHRDHLHFDRGPHRICT